MKLYDILFEEQQIDIIKITGYHRNDNPDFFPL